MAKSNFDLCGQPAERATSRALAELRSGRPVVLVSGGQHRLVAAGENLTEEARAALLAEPDATMLVTAARFRALGLADLGDQAIPLAALPAQNFNALVAGRERPAAIPVGRSIAPAEGIALRLVRAAMLLPTAVVVPIAADAHPCLLRITEDEFAQYENETRHRPTIVARAPVPLDAIGQTEFVVFRGGEGMREQVAIVIGAPDPTQPVLMRIHSACLTGDLFGSLKCDCGDQLRGTARTMAEMGGGVLLYLDQEGRGNGIANKIRAYAYQAEGFDTFDSDQLLGFEADNRRFDFAAEMMMALGYTAVRLMTNNPEKIAALKAAGLVVQATVRVPARHTHENVDYLATKRDRAGHLFEQNLKATS